MSISDSVCLCDFAAYAGSDREIDYHWSQLWKAIVGLLDFLGGKTDELTSTTGVEQLLQEVCDISLYR